MVVTACAAVAAKNEALKPSVWHHAAREKVTKRRSTPPPLMAPGRPLFTRASSSSVKGPMDVGTAAAAAAAAAAGSDVDADADAEGLLKEDGKGGTSSFPSSSSVAETTTERLRPPETPPPPPPPVTIPVPKLVVVVVVHPLEFLLHVADAAARRGEADLIVMTLALA